MPNYKEGYVSPVGEFNSGFSITESAGYRTARQQVESFLLAGQVLQASRSAGSYDSDEDDPVDDPSLLVRDMELSEIGQIISSKSFEAPKGVDKGETGASVSPSDVVEVSDPKVEA